MAATLDPETLLASILEGIGQPFYALDADWRITLYNGDAARHFGRPASEMIGRIFWDIYPEDRWSERGLALDEVLKHRKPVMGETMSMVRPRWISYCMFPLADGVGVIFRDITEHKQAQEQRDKAEEALRARSAELQTVLETIPTAVVFSYEREVRRMTGNRRAAQLLRMPTGLMTSLSAPAGERPTHRYYRDGAEVPTADLPLQRAAKGEEVPETLLEVRFDNGDRRTLLMRAAPLRDPRGEVQGAVCAMADVTERHRYEDHLKLLLNELNHRVKNTLAIVQSIAALTLKGTDPTARADFEQRLLTLSAVHSLLTDHNWDGVHLHALARASLRTHFGGTRERITFAGEDFRLRPKSAVALSIALHELATNALKYGALSVEGGNVAVRWNASDGRFRLTWEESDGPAVAVPAHRGFGSRMIERGLAAEMQGEVRIDFRPAGVVCTIDAALDAIRDAGATT